MSFRKKIILSQLILFIVFIAALFPFINRAVVRLVRESLEESTNDLIDLIDDANSENELVERLKNQEFFVFFHITLIDEKKQIIYDSYGERFLHFLEAEPHPELEEAEKDEIGYAVIDSKVFSGRFAYIAQKFSFQGKTYYLLTAFPFGQIQDITKNFEIGFLIFSFVMLLFFTGLTWLIFNRLSQPIREIINTIKPYQMGKVEEIPKIVLKRKTSEEDEFKQLASTLNSLSEKVQSQIRREKDFVANASHELRTPITVIRGFVETLSDLPKISKETLAEVTEKILRNCERMENLVKSLLTLADLENIPESRFTACDLVVLVENCKHILLSVYSNASIKIQKDQDQMIISADADILELAILNLLDNAAKYSKPPAKIIIKLEDMGESVKLMISDQGIGIPLEDLDRIFERFYTVDKARSRKFGGAGLGLSIVKTIIDKHRGKIQVASKVGEGTIFTILLPKHR
ncbi:MAG: HAMP domain-containing histidine kinase [Chlamydiae bacterium]|nr:HAMP domain-containing histidine kinase [Chlamydiota bacterium]